jgi:hypothetical protein
MKELESHFKLSKENTVELNVKKKQEVEHTLMGSIKPQPGHFIWELNQETGEIKKADFKRDTVALFGSKLPSEELIVKSDCVYIPALNAANAKKKYLKNNQQSAYFVKDAPMNIEDISFGKRSIYGPSYGV